jgi:ERCC4-type nuclease
MLVIDYHEHKLIDYLSKQGQVFDVTNLPVGDIVFTGGGDDEGSVQEVIIERKTWEDTISSMVDGRYREQKTRLQRQQQQTGDDVKNVTCVYLFEDPRFKDTQTIFEDVTTRGLFVSLMLNNHFKVLCTGSVEETGQHVMAIETTLKKWQAQPKRNSTEITHSQSLITKKSCKTPHDAALAALTCVRGVSVAKARSIMESLGNFQQIAGCDPKILADIKCGQRRIGKDLAERIHLMLNAFTK